MVTRGAMKRNGKSAKSDVCQTPPIGLKPIIPYLNPGLTIWEPAMGEGLVVDELRANGFTVVGGDILTGQNFFTYEPEEWGCLVTNPPFTLKFKWLARCYQLGKPFGLLLPVETMGCKTAQLLFKQYGVEVIWLDARINFKMPNKGWSGKGAQFPTAWFTWGLGIGKENTFASLKGL